VDKSRRRSDPGAQARVNVAPSNMDVRPFSMGEGQDYQRPLWGSACRGAFPFIWPALLTSEVRGEERQPSMAELGGGAAQRSVLSDLHRLVSPRPRTMSACSISWSLDDGILGRLAMQGSWEDWRRKGSWEDWRCDWWRCSNWWWGDSRAKPCTELDSDADIA